MPGSVNRFPSGLLGLLEAKQNGRTPDESEDRLRFGMDLTSFYLSGTGLKVAVENENTAALPLYQNYATVSIPALEVWAVMGVSTLVTHVNPGEISLATPTISNLPVVTETGLAGPSEFFLAQTNGFNATTLAVGAAKVFNCVFNEPLIVKSPVTFASRLLDAASGVLGMQTNVLYYRLEA